MLALSLSVPASGCPWKHVLLLCVGATCWTLGPGAQQASLNAPVTQRNTPSGSKRALSTLLSLIFHLRNQILANPWWNSKNQRCCSSEVTAGVWMVNKGWEALGTGEHQPQVSTFRQAPIPSWSSGKFRQPQSLKEETLSGDGAGVVNNFTFDSPSSTLSDTCL